MVGRITGLSSREKTGDEEQEPLRDSSVASVTSQAPYMMFDSCTIEQKGLEFARIEEFMVTTYRTVTYYD